jgi:hypothetical protein
VLRPSKEIDHRDEEEMVGVEVDTCHMCSLKLPPYTLALADISIAQEETERAVRHLCHPLYYTLVVSVNWDEVSLPLLYASEEAIATKKGGNKNASGERLVTLKPRQDPQHAALPPRL